MRVVAGRFGGRRLRAPPGDATRARRPTACARRCSRCSAPLDGARRARPVRGLGRARRSRRSRAGAAQAVFVERDARRGRAIEANLDALGSRPGRGACSPRRPRARFRAARERGDAYDLVFLDPPYRLAAGAGPRALAGARRACSPPAARIVTESDRRAPLELDRLPLTDERRYGDTLIRIHSMTPDATASPSARAPTTRSHRPPRRHPPRLEDVRRGHRRRRQPARPQGQDAVRRRGADRRSSPSADRATAATSASSPSTRSSSSSRSSIGAKAIVKGLRAISDFEYEFEMNQLNRRRRPRSRPST